MYTCETIVVKGPTSLDNPEGLTVINKSDYDPEKYTLLEEPAAEEQKAPEPAPAPAPATGDKPWQAK